jgi:aspartate aminotransferase-like enzyme
MNERGYTIDKGYGKIKGQTFRVPHMGDMTTAELQDILGYMGEFVG